MLATIKQHLNTQSKNLSANIHKTKLSLLIGYVCHLFDFTSSLINQLHVLINQTLDPCHMIRVPLVSSG